jgi:hypothetical protein
MRLTAVFMLMSLILFVGGCRLEDPVPGIGADAAASCEEPPPSIVWNGKPYDFVMVGNENLEPGMKLGALSCEQGVFTQQSEVTNAVFNIYTYGSPLESGDLLYFGKWGRALYTPADERHQTHPKSDDETDIGDVNPKMDIQIREEPISEPKSEGRTVKLVPQPDVRSGDEPVRELKPEVRKFKLDPELEKELAERKRPMQGLFETTVETEKTGEKLRIRFSLKNVSDRDLTVVYGSGQKYDFWILNEQNEEVFRWSHDSSFIAVILREELPKSGQFDFEEEWNGRDNDGHPVPTGQYTLVVQVMAGLESGQIDPEELTAKTKIEWESADFL